MTEGKPPELAAPKGPLHAQEDKLQLIIVVYSPESVLPDVLAMHTIEMIPKSMILFTNGKVD